MYLYKYLYVSFLSYFMRGIATHIFLRGKKLYAQKVPPSIFGDSTRISKTYILREETWISKTLFLNRFQRISKPFMRLNMGFHTDWLQTWISKPIIIMHFSLHLIEKEKHKPGFPNSSQGLHYNHGFPHPRDSKHGFPKPFCRIKFCSVLNMDFQTQGIISVDFQTMEFQNPPTGILSIGLQTKGFPKPVDSWDYKAFPIDLFWGFEKP